MFAPPSQHWVPSGLHLCRFCAFHSLCEFIWALVLWHLEDTVSLVPSIPSDSVNSYGHRSCGIWRKLFPWCYLSFLALRIFLLHLLYFPLSTKGRDLIKTFNLELSDLKSLTLCTLSISALVSHSLQEETSLDVGLSEALIFGYSCVSLEVIFVTFL